MGPQTSTHLSLPVHKPLMHPPNLKVHVGVAPVWETLSDHISLVRQATESLTPLLPQTYFIYFQSQLALI